MKPSTFPTSLLKTGSFATSMLDPILDPSAAPSSSATAASISLAIKA